MQINCGLGESDGSWQMKNDANIATGSHAGDPVIIDHSVELAKLQQAIILDPVVNRAAVYQYVELDIVRGYEAAIPRIKCCVRGLKSAVAVLLIFAGRAAACCKLILVTARFRLYWNTPLTAEFRLINKSLLFRSDEEISRCWRFSNFSSSCFTLQEVFL